MLAINYIHHKGKKAVSKSTTWLILKGNNFKCCFVEVEKVLSLHFKFLPARDPQKTTGTLQAFKDRVSLYPWLAWNLPCGPGWPWCPSTQICPPLGLKVCTTVPRYVRGSYQTLPNSEWMVLTYTQCFDTTQEEKFTAQAFRLYQVSNTPIYL